jgi:hypothetical protein
LDTRSALFCLASSSTYQTEAKGASNRIEEQSKDGATKFNLAVPVDVIAVPVGVIVMN